MLPRLESLSGYGYPISFDELASVSKNITSLISNSGLAIEAAPIDLSALRFPRLSKVEIESKKDSDLHFIIKVLENSIPLQGRSCLKSLDLGISCLDHPSTLSAVDYGQLAASLIRVIEVHISLYHNLVIS
jgi:hypothetical protein